MKTDFEFVWEQCTEKDWAAFHKVITGTPKEANNAMFGSIYVGTLCFELLHTMDPDDWYAYFNGYQLGVDDGYGEAADGTPYSLLDDGPEVSTADTYEAFVAEMEANICKYVASRGLEDAAGQETVVW